MFTRICTTFLLLFAVAGCNDSPTPTESHSLPDRLTHTAQSHGNLANDSSKSSRLEGTRKVEFGVARDYTIVERDDISVKAFTKPLSAYKHGEVERLPTNLRKRYRIIVPPDISPENLEANMIQLVKDETSRDPDIDEIVVFAYDRKEDFHDAYTFGKLEWCPNGDWVAVTPEIARLNDRSTYKFNIDIKAKVGDPSGRPTESELRIYDALEKELWADPDVPEDEVNKKVAVRLNMTVEELNKIWLKVTSYQLK